MNFLLANCYFPACSQFVAAVVATRKRVTPTQSPPQSIRCCWGNMYSLGVYTISAVLLLSSFFCPAAVAAGPRNTCLFGYFWSWFNRSSVEHVLLFGADDGPDSCAVLIRLVYSSRATTTATTATRTEPEWQSGWEGMCLLTGCSDRIAADGVAGWWKLNSPLDLIWSSYSAVCKWNIKQSLGNFKQEKRIE